MFIDVHAHTRRIPCCPRMDGSNYATPEQILAGYDAAGIERGCILPLASPEATISPMSNEDVLDIAARYNGRFIPFCNIDPRAISNTANAPLERVLLYYKENGCRGIGEVTANLPILHPFMQNLFRAAEIAELPVTFHLHPEVGGSYGVVDESGLPGLEETIARFPKLVFFGHSQTFWAELGANPTTEDRFGYPTGKVTEGRVAQLLRKYPGLNGDLSAGSGCNALTRDREYAISFLNEFQDRLLFGTDIATEDTSCLTRLASFLIDLRDKGDISETVFNKVARENAIRLLHLDN